MSDQRKRGLSVHLHPRGSSDTFNHDRLTPDELGLKLAAFGSWPKDGLRPAGLFSQQNPEGASEFYSEQGYLVIEDALSPNELEELKVETRTLRRNENGAIDGVTAAGNEISDDEEMSRVLCVHFPHMLSSRIFATLCPPAILELLKELLGPNLKCMQLILFVQAAGTPDHGRRALWPAFSRRRRRR